LDGKVLKIFETEIVNEELPELDNLVFEDFTLKTDNKKHLLIQTPDSFLAIKSLQLEGKKRMTTEEFLRGYRF
jgi:methionyl-tRNA formyltransferase